MRKQRLTIAALIIAIIGLSIGFAAFSNTLTVSQGATVDPSASNLKVVFANNYYTEQVTTFDTTAVVPTSVGATGSNGTINNNAQNGPTLTGLTSIGSEEFGSDHEPPYGTNAITSVTIYVLKANVSGISDPTFKFDSNANCTNSVENDYKSNSCITWVNG